MISLSVDECVRLVSKSTRPVIILGSQSTLPPVPADELRQALEVRQHCLVVFGCHICYDLLKKSSFFNLNPASENLHCLVHGFWQHCFLIKPFLLT